MIVGGDILGHRQSEGCLTHGRTAGNDDQVGGLPAAGLVVKTMITAGNTCQAVFVFRSLLYHLHGLGYHRVYLCVVLFHILL